MDMKKYDVVALGELLIDLTQNGISQQGNPMLEANPGGAPCNVLALLSKLGHSTGFIGKVGCDGFGEQLCRAIQEVGIDHQGLCWDEYVHTTLAVVHTKPDGDRDFSFYRNPGADMSLTARELKEDMIRSCKIFHFGTLSMTDEPVRSATYQAIRIAEEAGCLRSFDPNLRPPLWVSLDVARDQTLYGMAHCDILKISDNEIQWLTGEEDYDKGIDWIRGRFPNIQLILLSMGREGSRGYCGKVRVEVPAVTDVKAIERRYFLRRGPAPCAAVGAETLHGGGTWQNAVLRQRCRCHRHHPQGCPPGDAGRGRNPEADGAGIPELSPGE